MKSNFGGAVAVVLAAGILATPCLRAEDEPDFRFDGQAFFLRSDREGIFEYLPADETFENWTTLISVRQFSGTDDPKAYAQKLLQNAKASSPHAQGLLMENAEAGSYIVDFMLPEGEGDDVAFEWNLWRVEQKGDGVEAVQYAVRVPAGAGVGGQELIAAREKIVPELAMLEIPAPGGSASAGTESAAAGDGGQIYAYPSADDAMFSMEVPADWTVEADAKGAWIVAADKKFTVSVVAVDPADVEDAVESIKEQSAGRFASYEWSETMAPQTNPATGVTFRSIDGNAEDKGVKHKLSVCVFSKEGAEKSFILATWSPEADLASKGDAIFKMLGSAAFH